MRDYTPDARQYELMTIFTPDVADDTVLDVLERVTEYVRGVGGTVYQVLYDAPWGRRRFAYPIRHGGRDVRDGIYSVIHFDLRPAQITEVERDLKLDEQVLRFLLTIREHVAAAPEPENEESQPAPEPTAIAAGDLQRQAATAREAADAAAAERTAAAAPSPAAQRQAAPPATEPVATQPAPAEVPTEPDAVADAVEPTDRQNDSDEAATARPVTSESATELNTDEAEETSETPANPGSEE